MTRTKCYAIRHLITGELLVHNFIITPANIALFRSAELAEEVLAQFLRIGSCSGIEPKNLEESLLDELPYVRDEFEIVERFTDE